MSITIAGITFDDCEYDARGDVLYLSVGSPRKAARTVATPEGHAIDYDEKGSVIGMVLVNVRFLLDRDGAVTITQMLVDRWRRLPAVDPKVLREDIDRVLDARL